MRLISYRDGAGDRLGVVADDHALPADTVLPGGPRSMAALLAGGPRHLEALARAAADATPRITAEGTPLAELALLSPVPRPGKVVAIGLNYFAHAAEQGTTPPEEPLIFAKFPTAVVGHGAEIRWDPALTGQVDYEAELAVVIGRTARRVSQADALDHVLGYTCANDVSARDLQFGDRQWVRGKSLDTFCPLGPVLLTSDEIPDPQTLSLSCTVSGERRQEGSTADMIFPVARLVSHCSQAFTLEPGDVIVTGTPPGVGVYSNPQRFLRDGDVVEVEIERIGRLANVCRTEPASAG